MRLLLSVALGGVVSRFAFVGLLDYQSSKYLLPFPILLLLLSQNTLLRERERERERERDKKRKSFLVSFSSFVLFSSEADDVNDDDNERERESIEYRERYKSGCLPPLLWATRIF